MNFTLNKLFYAYTLRWLCKSKLTASLIDRSYAPLRSEVEADGKGTGGTEKEHLDDLTESE